MLYKKIKVMEFSAIQIATFLSGTVEGDPDVKVYNVAKIEEGAPGMLSFLANPKYEQYLYTTNSSIVLINNDLPVISFGCSIPIVSINVGTMSAKHPPSASIYAGS